MNEELKFIISSINRKFSTDLNIISINSLSNIEFLQLVNKVLSHLGVCSLVQVEENLELAVFIILESLQKLRYTPPTHVSPELFRDGLLAGNLKIIVPILSWLLQNEEEVTKRVYLAKFVEKIDVPLEILSDSSIQEIYQLYESKIEEFWKTYSVYKKEKKQEQETWELKKDIEKMDFDLLKLIHRTNNQKEKVDNIPNRDTILTQAKAYTNEMMEERRLQEQLSSYQTVLNQTENQIKILSESISKRKISDSLKSRPLEYLESEFQTNKLLAEEELPKEYEMLNLELSLLETVLKEADPVEDEIDMLNEELEKLQLQIQTLNEKKLSLIHSNIDTLRPYQNQSAMIENKKHELTKSVIAKKENLNKLTMILAEKQDKLISYVGGPILHGNELRNYVSKLRDLSVEYKEKKSELQGLLSELAVISRTFEVLNLLDSNIQKIIEEKKERTSDSNGTDNEFAIDNISNEQKLRTIVLQLVQDTAKKQDEAKQVKEEFIALNREYQTITETYKNSKEEFERITGFTLDKLEKCQAETSSCKDEIEKYEDKWKILRREIERKEELLLRLSQDVINSVDDDDGNEKETTHLGKLENTLREKEAIKRELHNRKEKLNNKKDEARQQLEIINHIFQIITCKQRLIQQHLS